MIYYRTATIDDIGELISLRLIFLQEVEKVDSSKPVGELKKSLENYFQKSIPDKSYVSWLALNENKIVATSGLSFNIVPPSHGNPKGEEAYIMNMYTLPEYRKRGIAKILFDKTLEEAIRRGARKIRLHATPMGRPIYLKKGFEERNDEMVLFLG